MVAVSFTVVVHLESPVADSAATLVSRLVSVKTVAATWQEA
jgi:hypothetical protein